MKHFSISMYLRCFSKISQNIDDESPLASNVDANVPVHDIISVSSSSKSKRGHNPNYKNVSSEKSSNCIPKTNVKV